MAAEKGHSVAAQLLVDAETIVDILDCNKKIPLDHAFKEEIQGYGGST